MVSLPTHPTFTGNPGPDRDVKRRHTRCTEARTQRYLVSLPMGREKTRRSRGLKNPDLRGVDRGAWGIEFAKFYHLPLGKDPLTIYESTRKSANAESKPRAKSQDGGIVAGEKCRESNLDSPKFRPGRPKKFLFSGLYKTREERTGIKPFLMVLAKGKRPKFTI